MNKLQPTLLSLICVALIGCVTRTTTTGTDFDASKIGDIKKGVTTTEELVGLLGQPFSKSVKSADEVIWYYTRVKATSTASLGWNSPNIKTEGHKKNLELLIKDGVVVNYTFDEGPFQIESREGSK